MGNVKQYCAGFLGMALMGGCASTPDLSPGNPLPGIGLGASGNSIILSWAEEGPLARQMNANSTLTLVASYDTARGPVSNEVVTTARPSMQHRAVQFDLPNILKNTPNSQVCFRIVQNRRSIPVRIAQFSESSDAFYYSEWSQMAANNASLRRLEFNKSVLDQSVANYEAGNPSFYEWANERNLARVEQCESLQVDAHGPKPADAITGPEKVSAAKNHCVALFNEVPALYFRHTRRYKQVLEENGVPIRARMTGRTLASEVQREMPAGHRLFSSVSRMVSDLNAYGQGQRYLEANRLPIDDTALDNWVFSGGQVSTVMAVALTESYNACINEAENRFEASYRSWQTIQNSTNLQQRTELLRGACRARFESESNRLERLEGLREEQSANAAEIQRLVDSFAVSLPQKKELISQACPR